MHIKVGSRGSKLALAQTQMVIDALNEQYPDYIFEIVVIKTTGDKEQTKALDAIGNKGLFTDEIENALRLGEIDFAIHSMKDMPTEDSLEFVCTAIMKREDPRDVLILREAKSLDELNTGAIIGTGSKRREFQLKMLRPDIETVVIRGNIDTRIAKLYKPMADGRYMDGIILAAAGLKRLGYEDKIDQYFGIEEMIPAPAQGIIAIQIVAGNKKVIDMIECLIDKDTMIAADLERKYLSYLNSDCHKPVGAYLKNSGNGEYKLYGIFGNDDGSEIKTAALSGNADIELVKKVVDITK